MIASSSSLSRREGPLRSARGHRFATPPTIAAMTLDEFVGKLGKLRETVAPADAELIDKLDGLAKDWLANERTVRELIADLDRLLGHIWLSEDETHAQVPETIRALAVEVAALGGMTVNERLYTFGLFDRWDLGSPQDQETVRRKVEAD